MSDSWISILLGWPAILIAFLIAILGILRRKPLALIAPVILVLPIALYLFGAPKVSWLALLIPACFIGAGVAIKFRRYHIAWLCLIPNFSFFCWLAVMVLGQ
ncbi:MAG: hypothetical protein HN764_16055 [Gammaproteobacteria bacterium]|jgi:hypothetical protein|nr:hypothetical protein [Gammaproteobacteria bacterium]